jgi:hypothetical protein
MPAKPLTRILYTAEAVIVGGRAGHGRTTDGRLDVQLAAPEEMGGQSRVGTNPEQLFAIGSEPASSLRCWPWPAAEALMPATPRSPRGSGLVPPGTAASACR